MSWNLLKFIKINIFSFVLPFLFKSHLWCFLKPCDIRWAWNVRIPHRYIQLLRAFFGCQTILTALYLVPALILQREEALSSELCRGMWQSRSGRCIPPISLLSHYLFITISNKLCPVWEMQIDLVATEPKSWNGPIALLSISFQKSFRFLESFL